LVFFIQIISYISEISSMYHKNDECCYTMFKILSVVTGSLVTFITIFMYIYFFIGSEYCAYNNSVCCGMRYIPQLFNGCKENYIPLIDTITVTDSNCVYKSNTLDPCNTMIYCLKVTNYTFNTYYPYYDNVANTILNNIKSISLYITISTLSDVFVSLPNIINLIRAYS
jgi:hypothetical protein